MVTNPIYRIMIVLAETPAVRERALGLLDAIFAALPAQVQRALEMIATLLEQLGERGK